MLNKIKKFLDTQKQDKIPQKQSLTSDIQLATACLMTATLHADYEVTLAEEEEIQKLLITEFDLSKEQTNELVYLAKTHVQNTTSLFEFTNLINKEYSYQDKCHIIKLLWKVACADNHIHHYEEHLIRRISDLIYVSHSDFIQAKLQAN